MASKLISVFAAVGMVAAVTGANADQVELKPRKLGIFVNGMQSEALARWALHAKAAAEKLHWEVILKDGQSNPAVIATLLPELVNENVDAVITMAMDAALIGDGLKAAKAKNIPVISTAIEVDPSGKELFTANYGPPSFPLGVALADYLLKQDPKPDVVMQTISVVFGADQLVAGAKDELTKRGATIEAVADVDITNLINSFGQTAGDLGLGHPKAKYLISCCDFAPLIDIPALKAANRTDMVLLTRYDNDSTLAALRAGAPIVTAVNHTDLSNLEAIDALAAYFANKTPIPATPKNPATEIRVIDKTNVPASGSVWSFDADLAAYGERWAKAYKF
jgi:ABC-type sugar transport system substrate-binding protein